MMNSKKNKCDTIIKTAFPFHKKCCSDKQRKGEIKDGSFLIQFCSSKPLSPSDQYCICSTMRKYLRENRISPAKAEKPEPIPLPEIPPPTIEPMVLPTPSSREDRFLLNSAKKTELQYLDMIEELHTQNEYLKDIFNDDDVSNDDRPVLVVNDTTHEATKRIMASDWQIR